ncbi:MAG TPA: GNAT family N-acetyltransferase [Chitinophagaceae bacterium]|nr:GNAT family N-acetyltransferase [Chitinophagaceae bacterium]HPH30330.1 GNAT family N-acetyltransferase [Chitinophagaceae bacterium]HPN57786.1 GNAT family N-acetyltransferase [Chitinophagaceae bacterium]
MTIFSDPHIGFAGTTDIPAIMELLNSAYRGESSRKGWTTEADLIAGNVRTDEQNLTDVMAIPGSVFLKYTNEDGQLQGCVNLQVQDQRVYLGMFSVHPGLQGTGIGKIILRSAEEFALSRDCTRIYMSVISVRAELIAWYQRHGYADTGERKAFKEDGLTGKHLRELEFMTLEKPL